MKLIRFDSSIIQSDLISFHVYGKYYFLNLLLIDDLSTRKDEQ